MDPPSSASSPSRAHSLSLALTTTPCAHALQKVVACSADQPCAVTPPGNCLLFAQLFIQMPGESCPDAASCKPHGPRQAVRIRSLFDGR